MPAKPMNAAPNVKPRQRTGSWSVFEKRYKPIDNNDGQMLREWNDPDILAAPESLVWTVLDCDGQLIVSPGFATVNYMGRILCATPWNDSEFANTGYTY